mmetsp:Transcript_45950/g.71991  ORF Transcript_45950/g.71991 Transcript_45950/m.71991 type:complete len:248 (-) Transcript_45950:432-1175(-)
MATIAVLYSALSSGMGDVGKFAVMHAVQKGISVRPVALTWSTNYDEAVGLDVDVADKAVDGKERVKSVLQGLDYVKLDMAHAGAKGKLEEVFTGVDGVVACLGSRQPGQERWCHPGAEKVSEAMKAKGIKRLVVLSSMGIGDDYLPLGAMKLFWGFLLRTLVRSSFNDLNGMEDLIANKSPHLDYVIVRPMGLTPTEPAKGKSDILQKRGDGNLAISISKEDVAEFMLQECSKPTLHNQAVTIGYKV